MKNVLLFILMPFILFGQADYQTILPNANAFFQSEVAFNLYDYDSHKFFRGVKVIDSISDSGFTRYKFFYEYHDNNYSQTEFPVGECVNMEAQCWLGPEVIVYENGLNVFFNRDYDSIFIYTQANLNDSWTFYITDNGDIYNAVVTNISEKDFLGISNLVKTITITGEGNTFTLEISKNYGFIKTINFRDFPGFEGNTYQVYEHNLKGLSEPPLGYQQMTRGDVLDYEVGDEFHWEKVNGGVDYHYRIEKVIDKELLDNNAVVYTYETTKWWYNPYGSGNGFDTIVDTITDLALVIDDNLPFEASEDVPHRYMLDFDDYNQRPKTTLGSMWFWNFDSCYSMAYEIIYSKGEAIKGVGFNHYYCDNTYSMNEYIVYFKKGDETWGTPLNPPVSVNENEKSLVIHVFPNPAKNFIFIEIPDFDNKRSANISVFDLNGKVVFKDRLKEKNLKIDTSNWPEGLFFFRISSDGVVTSGKFTVKK
jgi:hypothetical protein